MDVLCLGFFPCKISCLIYAVPAEGAAEVNVLEFVISWEDKG